MDLSSVRSGRATPALVENILITAYGGTAKMRVMEMATITAMDAKTIMIAPFDPTQLADIEKGIQEANVGLTPIVDGEVIRITIPPLSEERRQEYLKLAKAKLESGKIMIRQIRQQGMKDFSREEDAGTMSEDQRKVGEKKLQELTDEMVAELETMEERKEAELMQI